MNMSYFEKSSKKNFVPTLVLGSKTILGLKSVRYWHKKGVDIKAVFAEKDDFIYLHSRWAMEHMKALSTKFFTIDRKSRLQWKLFISRMECILIRTLLTISQCILLIHISFNFERMFCRSPIPLR